MSDEKESTSEKKRDMIEDEEDKAQARASKKPKVSADDDDDNDDKPATTGASPSKENETTAKQKSKKQSKRNKKKDNDPQVLELRRTIQMSCKDDNASRGLAAWDEAVRNGVKMEAHLYPNLLALCAGLKLGERSSSSSSRPTIHVGMPKTAPSTTPQEETKEQVETDTKVDGTASTEEPKEATKEAKEGADISWEDRLKHAFRIKAAMDEEQVPLTEAAYTAIIKLLAKTGDLEQANTLLMESEKVQQCNPKLRLYSSLLQAYAKAKRPLDAVRIWYRLTQQKLIASEREYLALMRCARACQSPTLMTSVLTDLAEDVPVPSRDTTQTIIDWFTDPIAASSSSSSLTSSATATTTAMAKEDEADLQDLLDKVHTPLEDAMRMVSPCMGPVQASTGWIMSRDCSIDASTGTLTSGCLQGESLHPIEIAPETWQDMKKANETIVLSGQLQQHKSQYQGGGKGSKNLPKDLKERAHHWGHFCRYLEQRKTLDVVIDGANIGFYQQNFEGAPKHVSYDQIDWVIDAFRAQGKSVLVVMHHRHFNRQKMPRKFVPLVDKWIRQDLLYRTPPGMNDDWFWMHVALARPGTLVVTNDEMRDHHFQRCSTRSFSRWRDRHQVHFEFGAWESHKDEKGGRPSRRRAVTLTFPDPYTRRIQRVADGLVVPLPKHGDENRFLDGCFAETDDVPKEETYVCIRPKKP